MEQEKNVEQQRSSQSGRVSWIWGVILLGIILLGAYLRFVGIGWDDNHHLHPDERFLTMVETSIAPVNSISDYFNTSISSLNPGNRGHTFFVYGTLPIFLVRYLGEWLGQTGFDQIHIVGRVASGVMDLLIVLLVYLTALRLYDRQRLALLAAAFSAFSVLPIQISHFFVVDNFINFFVMLAMYIAVLIATRPVNFAEESENYSLEESEEFVEHNGSWQVMVHHWKGISLFLAFGAALGMAVASKVNAAPAAVLLPAAAAVYLFRLPESKREEAGWLLLRNMVLGAVVSLITFRIFQPYSFNGPGFFGIGLNENWINTMKSLAAQTSGDVDFPPALQWARRSVFFSGTNMILWGLGLPQGILAWTGFLWMGWRIIRRGEWRHHVVLWGWTAIYFTWQSFNGNPTMRYQLPVYPMLAIIAAWAVFKLWDVVSNKEISVRWQRTGRVLVPILGIGVLAATFAWAFAFTRIYTRPVTRVEASEWIYQNVPAAFNLRVANEAGDFNVPISFQAGRTISASQPLVMAFKPRQDALLAGVEFAHILNRDVQADLSPVKLNVLLSKDRQGTAVLASSQLVDAFDWGAERRGNPQEFYFTFPPDVSADEVYYLILRPDEGVTLELAGPMALRLNDGDQAFKQALAEPMGALREGLSHTVHFNSREGGRLQSITVPWAVDWEQYPQEKTLRFKIIQPENEQQVIGQVDLVSSLPLLDDARGESYTLKFDPPVQLEPGRQYILQVDFAEGQGAVAFYGSTQAKESTWDDALPVGLHGYSPFDYNNGLYRTEHNFEMYWDDNAEKLERFIDNLDQADFLFISSNRQWGTTTRVPERYPLTTYYYRNLIGCPEGEDILWCYRVAEPGMFEGNLGYELVYVAQSDPNLGSLRINTQFAEEAFTVYDHPKVLIFKKQADYDAERVRKMLSSVDLSMVVHVTPKQAAKHPGTLMLPDDRLAQQQAGGTWRELFNGNALINRMPWLGAVVWYLTLTLLGWMVLPLVSLALRSLPDKGYPFARLAGLLILAYLVWIAGSAGVVVSRLMISGVLALMLAVNAFLLWKQKIDLRALWHSNRRYVLVAEGIFLAFFLLDLLIRIGNPDLWHPYKGGEKPMDFSYFQAVLKSSTFPPYDPWFGGGYINYYYYGFVVVGVLVKWLGLEPAIAYNLILPTLFAFVGAGAFSLGWNLFAGENPWRGMLRKGNADHGLVDEADEREQEALAESDETDAGLSEKNAVNAESRPLLAGLTASLAVLVLGNFGTVRMIVQGFMRIAAPGGSIDGAGLFRRWGWFFTGMWRFLSGTPMPYPPGDWYWIPSRAIPGNVITEFPFFTFLYADLHAHMIALPITLLALVWALAIIKGRWQWQAKGDLPAGVHLGATVLVGSLVLGALRPTNTWDFPTYLIIGTAAWVYTYFRFGWKAKTGADQPASKTWFFIASLAVLLAFTWLLYQPFSHWYGAGYDSIQLWKVDEHSPIGSYLVHWGLLLFVIVTWMVMETIHWMDSTPVSFLNKLKKYSSVIYGAAALLAGLTILLAARGAVIAILALPLAAWVAVLMLRSDQPDEKRLVSFLVGSALFMTMFVEVFVLEGDIGRMNTVFKFYLQAWTLLAISAAAALVWLMPLFIKFWSETTVRVWRVVLIVLVFGAALFPITAGLDKITDRMSNTAPHSLDGLRYMQTSTYNDQGAELDLNQDYEAIRWMQQNIEGSPIIVEGNTTEYRWGSRFTINTGLPGVVGWNWHQRQQRGVVSSEWVTRRVDAISLFYSSTNRSDVEDFLRRYDVQYIVVGQLEKANYPGPGLQKFEDWDGDLWETVYHQEDTTIYRSLLPENH